MFCWRFFCSFAFQFFRYGNYVMNMKHFTLSLIILLFAATAWGQSGTTTKSFSWKGLSLNYPDNYTITNKRYDRPNKSHSFICTTTDDGYVSLVAITFSKNLAKELSTSLSRKAFFKEIIPAIVSELESRDDTYKSLQHGDIKEFPIPYPNVFSDYTAIVETIDVQGRIVVFIQNEFIVTCILTTDDSQYLQELDDIVKSITVK